MKIALELKNDLESIIHDLENKKFNYSISGSFNTIWVYDLKYVEFLNNQLQITKNDSLDSYKFNLTNVSYFEIEKGV